MTVKEIKQKISLRDEITSRGIAISRSGFCRCPFHDGDNTASLKVYENNTWWCFGCSKGGDVIDFVSLYDGLSFQESCRKLAGGSLDFGSRKHIALEEMRRKEREKAAKRREEALKVTGQRILYYGGIFRKSEPFSDAWKEAYEKYQLACYKEDCILDGSYTP